MKNTQSQICFPLIEYKRKSKKCKGKDWIIKDKIGEPSVFGEIWQACCYKNCNYVLKYQPFKLKIEGTDEYYDSVTALNIINEAVLQDEIAKLGLALKVEDMWLCKNGGVIVTKALKMTVGQLLKDYTSIDVRLKIVLSVIKLINELHENGYAHGDTHLNNIMVDFDQNLYETALQKYPNNDVKQYEAINYKYYFIDMGLSQKTSSKEYFKNDYIKLYSNLQYRSDFDKMPNPENVQDIIEYLKILVMLLF